MVYRSLGYYSKPTDDQDHQSVLGALFVDAIPASVPVIAFLAMAQIMTVAPVTEWEELAEIAKHFRRFEAALSTEVDGNHWRHIAVSVHAVHCKLEISRLQESQNVLISVAHC